MILHDILWVGGPVTTLELNHKMFLIFRFTDVLEFKKN